MSIVLYITANPKAVEDSYSLSVGDAFLKEYQQINLRDQILKLDLYQLEIPYIDLDVFNGWGKLQQGRDFKQLTTEEQNKVGRINDLCDQFVNADKYVFVTPMWNLSIPPKMKAYLDTICIAGRTFKYTESGPVGLLTHKKALHIQSRGGVYSEGPTRDFEFGDKYIRALLTFLGIPSIESIIIEGTAQDPTQAEAIKSKALQRGVQVAKEF
ncbi:FMN-dependent NADH-azoreductase [Desulfitobacterium sp. Sab5]|uniref:FMN-dependent NADH-azoreductase n=1 Tax=Desulfitobacterium nosdiversum TaxID=3375356 RepID=UPI003CED22DC